jgi:inosine-uridine nucleoside N-ribohydrolase
VVIDTDMAPDDWMAILYLLQRPDIAVKAITVVGTGETHCEPGVRNALKLIRLAGDSGIPVACGRETPLQGNHAFPDNLRERADSLNWMTLPDGESPNAGADAVDLLSQTIEGSPEKVSLLALGPLTNLAEAVQRDPGWLNNLAQTYIMGGALKVEGNVGFFGIDNHLAEWNFYVDPAAVKIVLESGAPLTLVPLDATGDAPVDLAFYRSLQANRLTPEAQFVYKMLSSQLDFIASGGYFFWDPLAAAVLADESLAEIKEGKVVVTTEEGQRSGVTRLLQEGTPIRYASSADGVRFREEFLRTLNQP